MFCPKCNGLILTIEQMENNLPCDRCQEEGRKHAEEFHKKYDIREEKDNVR